MSMKPGLLNYILLFLAAAFWAANFHLAVPALQHAPPLVIATVRYTIALLLLAGLLLYARSFPWRQMMKDWAGIVGVAIFGVFLFNFTYFKGMQTTLPVNASLIMALNPVTTILLSGIILKAQLVRNQLLGAAISLTGVVIVITRADWDRLINLSFTEGDLWILGTNFCFAMNHVLVKKYLTNLSPVVATMATSLVGLFFFLLVATPEIVATDFPALPAAFWVPVGIIGALGTTGAYIFWNRGIVAIGPEKSALFINIVPVLVAVYALLLGSSLTLPQVIGGLGVLTGIFVAQQKRNKVQKVKAVGK